MRFDGHDPCQDVTDLLIAGRAKIAAGWCKGHWDRRRLTWRGWRTQYCMLGALQAAAGRNDAVFQAAHRRLHNAMETLFERHRGGSIAYFQDQPERRKAHVLQVYDLAIEFSKGCSQ